MTLKQSSWTLSDVTGSQETISIEAVNTTIVGVSYGVDGAGSPIQVPISADGKSFQFKVLIGDNLLVATLISPGPNSELVRVQQKVGNNLVNLDLLFVGNQGNAWDPMIRGT